MEDPGQVQPDQQHGQGQGRDHAGRLKLKAPAHGLTRRPQRQKPAGQDQEADQHPGGEGQTVPARPSRIVRRRRQRRRLHRQHREDAGHQVQNQSGPARPAPGPERTSRRRPWAFRPLPPAETGRRALRRQAGRGRAGHRSPTRPCQSPERPTEGRPGHAFLASGSGSGHWGRPVRSGPPHGRCGRRHRDRNRPDPRRRPPAVRRSRSGSVGRPGPSIGPLCPPGAGRSRPDVRSGRPRAWPGVRRRRAPAGPATGSSAGARTSGRCTPETARPSSRSGSRPGRAEAGAWIATGRSTSPE